MCRRRSLTVSNIRWQKWSKTTFCHTHVLYLVTETKALLISALNSCNKQHKYKEHNFSLRFFLTIKQEVLSMDNFLRDRSSDMKTYFFSYLVSRNSTSEHSRKYLWVFQVRKLSVWGLWIYQTVWMKRQLQEATIMRITTDKLYKDLKKFEWKHHKRLKTEKTGIDLVDLWTWI